MDAFLNKVKKRLNERRIQVHAEWEARPAAVLVPLYRDESQWHLLFTRRTDSVNEHRGQVSFPGGAIEENDQNPIQTALREAEEEIGIRSTEIQVVGQLDPLLTVTQFHITPVVGVLPWPYQLKINPEEVARVFGVPIDWLSNSENLTTDYREPLISGPPIPVYHFKPFQGEIIWGATARIILDFLNTIQ
jgi:8-oxo-dGTP pyrophosphatase MutT (NUDIX family)